MDRRPLPLIAFCAAHCGKSLLWTATDALCLYILIRIVHIAPLMAGTLFVLSSFWNALIDGLWGYWLDRLPAIRGRLPVLCGVASLVAGASFAVLPFLPERSTVMAAFFLILFRTAFSVLDVPHNATAATLASTHGHLGIARWRSALGAAMTILIAVAALPLIAMGEGLGGEGMGTGARAIFCGLALLAVLLLAPLPWLVRTVSPDDGMVVPRSSTPRPPAPAREGRLPVGLIAFCLVQMLGFAALASIGKAVLHADSMPLPVLQYALLLLSTVRLAAIWLWAPVAGWIGSSFALAMAYMVSACAIVALPLAITLGTASSIFVLCLLGAATGGVGLLVWSNLSELLIGRQAASGYGLFTATSKIGLGLSGLMTGAWISQLGKGVTGGSLWPLAACAAAICLSSALLGLFVRGAVPGISAKKLREV
ncbi:MAG TPA: MFS transporter [Sphingobium sp.]|uniref:MFS transporter n=1 Tax=Sphingobium sp. TaxID=1912891 RepID=UPI002ED198EE